MKLLQAEFDRIEQYIVSYDTIEPSVSEVSVGWHLSHIIKVIRSVIKELKKSNPDNYKPSFSYSRVFILTFGWIPRGKGKAPKSVKLFEAVSSEELIKYLELAKAEIHALNELDQKAFFHHPYFKTVDLKRAKRFLKVHTKHHLKIVSDIIKASARK